MSDEPKTAREFYQDYRGDALSFGPEGSYKFAEDYAAYRLAARDKEIERLKEAAHKLIDYCEDHNWGTMPEPFDSINPLLKLLGRDSTPTKEQ